MYYYYSRCLLIFLNKKERNDKEKEEDKRKKKEEKKRKFSILRKFRPFVINRFDLDPLIEIQTLKKIMINNLTEIALAFIRYRKLQS